MLDMPALNINEARRYMNLSAAPSGASASPYDRHYARTLGPNNYFRYWDEAEARGITDHMLLDENLQLASKYDETRVRREAMKLNESPPPEAFRQTGYKRCKLS